MQQIYFVSVVSNAKNWKVQRKTNQVGVYFLNVHIVIVVHGSRPLLVTTSTVDSNQLTSSESPALVVRSIGTGQQQC